jgi:hypothetical protein
VGSGSFGDFFPPFLCGKPRIFVILANEGRKKAHFRGVENTGNPEERKNNQIPCQM